MDSEADGRDNDPPKSPRGDSSDLAIDSWVLAAIDSWLRTGRPREDIVSKVMTSFGPDDLREAANTLYKGKWCQPQISVPNTTRPDYSRKLAETVFDGLLSIQNQGHGKVSFWLQSLDIAKLPGVGPFSDTLDEPEVSARLHSVDNQLMQMMEKLKATERLESTVAALARTVTELQEQLKEARKGEVRGVAGEHPPGSQHTQQSWANIAGGQQRIGRVQTLARSGLRERSASSKRNREGDEDEVGRQREQSRRRLLQGEMHESREVRGRHPDLPGSALSQDLRKIAQNQTVDGFQEVRRRKRAIQKGCSTVEAEGGARPPCSVFISGTSTNTTVEVVKEKLVQCERAVRDGDEGELEIVNVEEIKLKIPTEQTYLKLFFKFLPCESMKISQILP